MKKTIINILIVFFIVVMTNFIVDMFDVIKSGLILMIGYIGGVISLQLSEYINK